MSNNFYPYSDIVMHFVRWMACFLADVMIIAPLIVKPKDGTKKYSLRFIFYIKKEHLQAAP